MFMNEIYCTYLHRLCFSMYLYTVLNVDLGGPQSSAVTHQPELVLQDSVVTKETVELIRSEFRGLSEEKEFFAMSTICALL